MKIFKTAGEKNLFLHADAHFLEEKILIRKTSLKILNPVWN